MFFFLFSYTSNRKSSSSSHPGERTFTLEPINHNIIQNDRNVGINVCFSGQHLGQLTSSQLIQNTILCRNNMRLFLHILTFLNGLLPLLLWNEKISKVRKFIPIKIYIYIPKDSKVVNPFGTIMVCFLPDWNWKRRRTRSHLNRASLSMWLH